MEGAVLVSNLLLFTKPTIYLRGAAVGRNRSSTKRISSETIRHVNGDAINAASFAVLTWFLAIIII